MLLDGANPEFSFTVRSAGSFDDRPLVDTPYISSRYILLPYYYYSSKQVIIYVCIYGNERNIITIYIYLLLANIIVVS